MIRFSEPCRRAIEAADREARRLGWSAVGMEHLLLALLRDETCTATALLRDEGADPSRLHQRLESRLAKAAAEERAGTRPLPAGSTIGANRIGDPVRAGQVVHLPPVPERLPRT